jgi:hypothetical protein
VDRSHRRGVPHKTNLADSADSARNVNDPLTVRLVCTKIPYQSIYGTDHIGETFDFSSKQTLNMISSLKL